jgi:hypothetical protein
MRKFLAGVLLITACTVLLPPRTVHASGGNSPMFTYLTGVSSITTTVVNVSTSSVTGATQVDSPTLANRVVLEIQNIDSTANLWCLAVSTAPTVNGGRKLSPGNSWVVSSMDVYYNQTFSTSTFTNVISSTTAKFWCLSDGTSATKAAVTQMY